jgi:glycosyltransferase involved in cell wall biosynthesis
VAGLRILHVTPCFEGAWAYGGVPRVAAAQCRELARRGHRVTVATTDARDQTTRLAADQARPGSIRHPWPVESLDDNLQLRVFPNLSNRIAYDLQLYLPLGLGHHLASHGESYDVAHLHGFHNLPGVIAARHLRRAGVPFLLQPHGTAPLIERRRLAKWIFDRVAGRRVMDDAQLLIALTGAEQRQLLDLEVEPQRIEIVANPIELDEVEPAPAAGRFRQQHGLTDEPLVVYMGQLSPRKQVHLLVEAFARAAPQKARLAIIGSDRGSLARIRREVQKHDLQSRTLLPGVIEGRKRFEALADADLLVYPGRDEIFGLVPLEALLCGTPVIVAGDCGCGEVIASIGGGEVVPSGDVDALAGAVHHMLADPQPWPAEVTQAAQRIRTRLSPQAIAIRLEEVYQLAIRQSGGAV